MHVFITGATGFIGHHLLQELVRRGHTARCLVRQGSERKLPVERSETAIVSPETQTEREGPLAQVEICFGDVHESDTIHLQGCDAVIHLVGIIEEKRRKGITFEKVHVEGTRHVVDRAKAAGIGRFVHMSANGARADRNASAYHTTKWQAEEIVRGAGFEHAVIFRPTIIFGDPGRGRPEFADRLATTLIRPFPILPVFGDGRYALQPVHITDVTAAFIDALQLEPKPGGVSVYCVGGPEKLTYVEILDRIARGMGRSPKPKLHLPLWFSKLLVRTFGSIGLLPISPAQFDMLIEGNTCPDESFAQDFSPTLRPFVPENLTHLREP
jgi:nucleoside-diphosphate-sugar epimerase